MRAWIKRFRFYYVEKNRKLIMGKFSIIIEETDEQIESKIRDILLKELNRVMDLTSNKSVIPIRNLIREALFSQPEVISLSGGRLAAEFGLSDGNSRISNIINFWVNNIVVLKKRATKSGGQIRAGLTIKMIQKDFEDVLSLGDATVITAKGQPLPWLEWLLKFGDKVIIRDYDVSFSTKSSSKSRSGLAIMIKGKGTNWRVPPEFAGTMENNFVTRAINSVEDDIISILEKQIRMYI